MRNITMRLISAALAAGIMLSVCPVSVFADAGGAEPESAAASDAAVTTIGPDDAVPGQGYVIKQAGEYELKAGRYNATIDIQGLSQNDTVTIRFNGEITVGETTSWFIFVHSGTVILEGEGSIFNENGTCVHNENSEATIIIKSGTYTSVTGPSTLGNATIENNMGTIKLEGGTVKGNSYGVEINSNTTTVIGNVNFEDNVEDVHLYENANFELTSAYQSTHKIKVGLEQSEYDNFPKYRQITTNSTEEMLEYVTSAREGYDVRYCDGTSEPDPGDGGGTGSGGGIGGGGGREDPDAGGGEWGGGSEFSLKDPEHPVVTFAENRFDDDNDDDNESRTSSYLYLVKHTHEWNYTADGAVITAKCTDTGCRYAEGVTLTLKAPEVQTEGDGKPCTATVENGLGVTDAVVDSVYYEGTGSTDYSRSTAAPTKAGTYKASVTAGGKTAEVTYTIAQKTYTLTVNAATICSDESTKTVTLQTDSDKVYHEEVELTAEDVKGKTFTGWSVESADGSILADTPDKTVTFRMPDGNVTATAHYYQENSAEVNNEYFLTVQNGEKDAETSIVKMGKEVSLFADEVEGKVFTGWTVTGLTDFSETPSMVLNFTMPGNDVTAIAHYRDDDPGQSAVTAGGAVAAVVGTTALAGIVGVNAYALGTEAYIRFAMPAGIVLPSNRMEMALLLWQQADKPEPAGTELFEDIDAEDADAQKAARWCVEQELMKVDEDELAAFHPRRAVTRLRVCLTWHKAKEKGLIG